MVCVTITIWHTGSGTNAVIGFQSSSLDGLYASSSQAWGWGGMGTPTDAEYLQTVAIPKTIAYLGTKWQSLYGTPMTVNNICGQGTPPPTPGGSGMILLIGLAAAAILFFGGKK